MKNILKRTIALVAFVVLSFQLQAQSLKNVRPVTTEGEYLAPVWSPDGSKLLFTGHHNDELFVLDLKNNSNVELIRTGGGIGYHASWSISGDKVIFREMTKEGLTEREVRSIDIKTKREMVLPNFDPGSLRQPVHNLRKAEEQLIVYINTKTLKLEAKYGKDGTPWVITEEEGSFYEPLLSPNEQYVVVHEGANMYQYAIDGNKPRKNLGRGLATSWHPDSNLVFTFEDSSNDGHNVSASELFAVKMKNSQKLQLTFSKELIETWADVSPNGKQIAFSDELSGQIFIADLEL